jgi:hypothetical protein
MQIVYREGALYRQLNSDLESEINVLSITTGWKITQSWL